ncbi:hypothetical protein QUF72_15115 [Desulfobacterales bacterium HSG2]|nr:hypothetical protein [Desulfobacterales bacterium HSG2]
MKVDILENRIFDTLNPKELERYLSNNRWKELKRVPGEVSIWDNNSERGKKFRIWLPLDNNLGDFAVSMKKVVRTLSLSENRSQLEILEDFNTITIGDVIRVKSEDIFNRTDSTLQLDDGIRLIQKAGDMLSAAACAAVETKTVFPSRKPGKVSEFMKNIRLGQTERDGYVVKLISPIVSQSEQLNFPDFPSESPFGRLATEKLMQSLSSLRDVALNTRKRGRFYFEPFQEIVSEGVSANLCDAVTDADDKSRYRPLGVSVSWSYIPLRKKVCDRVDFPTDIMPYIGKAARLFREKNPEEFFLEGYVTRLHREEKHGNGIITVVCIADGKKRRVRIKLNKNDYNEAVEAHRNGFEIRCRGELIKEGNSFRLDNPFNFKVIQDE